MVVPLFCPNCGGSHLRQENSRSGLPICNAKASFCTSCGGKWHKTEFCQVYNVMRNANAATGGARGSNFQIRGRVSRNVQQIRAVPNSGAGHVGRGSSHIRGESSSVMLGRGGIHRQSVPTMSNINTPDRRRVSHSRHTDAITAELLSWGLYFGGAYTSLGALIRTDDARENPLLKWHSEEPFENWSRAERFRMVCYLSNYPGVTFIQTVTPRPASLAENLPLAPAQPPAPKFSCNSCGKVFLQQDGLTSHIAAKHTARLPGRQVEAAASLNPASKRVKIEPSTAALSFPDWVVALKKTFEQERERADKILDQDREDRLRREEWEREDHLRREEWDREDRLRKKKQDEEERLRMEKDAKEREETTRRRDLGYLNAQAQTFGVLRSDLKEVIGDLQTSELRIKARNDRLRLLEQARTERQYRSTNQNLADQSTELLAQVHRGRELRRKAFEMVNDAAKSNQSRSVSNNVHAGSITTPNLHTEQAEASGNLALDAQGQAHVANGSSQEGQARIANKPNHEKEPGPFGDQLSLDEDI